LNVVYHGLLVVLGLFVWWVSAQIAASSHSTMMIIVFLWIVPFVSGVFIGINLGKIMRVLVP
jgi:hypothetical protein